VTSTRREACHPQFPFFAFLPPPCPSRPSRLHRSVYSIAESFVEATDSGRLDDPQCVRVSARYIIARCRELTEAFGIKTVYLVMDGKRCPLKADETQDREEKRRQNLEEARRCKSLGQRDRSQDKYKACIRIRDEFARAVMRAVEKEFRDRNCVFAVWSPYEADAQLTKLCVDNVADAVVTEDSDILVYSAAAHVAFPVLFKLDRSTGSCDVVSMDWLLSMKSEDVAKAVSTNSSMEMTLRRFALRQSKRSGFGVRLFVQSCVLAGSDYSINTLDGIGFVGAFKLVSDNAHRNDNVRLRKILQSLPSKTKKNLNMDEYEDRLAKSEAVFYYHYVKHTDGNVKPLATPRLSNLENGDIHHFTDHFPFMSRFGDDWSFLHVSPVPGDLASSSALASVSISNNLAVKQPAKTWESHISQLAAPPCTHNPYKKVKIHDYRRQPLTRNTENHLKESQEALCAIPSMSDGLADVNSYHPPQGYCNSNYERGSDPRYVKKQFPSVASTKIDSTATRLQVFPSYFGRDDKNTRLVGRRQGTCTADTHASFDGVASFEYGGDRDAEDDDGECNDAPPPVDAIADDDDAFPPSSLGNSTEDHQSFYCFPLGQSTSRDSISPSFHGNASTTCANSQQPRAVSDQTEAIVFLL
jgi:5'-3' exonuclease